MAKGYIEQAANNIADAALNFEQLYEEFKNQNK